MDKKEIKLDFEAQIRDSRDALKKCEEKLSREILQKEEAERNCHRLSCASTHGNQNNEYEEIGHRNEDGLVDVSKYCVDASLDVVDHKKYVSTDASDGSSRERLLGSFKKIVDCDATQKQNLLSTFEMPLDIIIDKCLIQEIMVEYNYVRKLIINVLKEAFKLQEHLLALRRYHFIEFGGLGRFVYPVTLAT
ncbi:hypothetical protein KIW84_014099 [Lathyrus oleraceus]|uniref:Uncharacterized protein n=1 Tax=Pisum sativum TaxID=3888 RepID=A0A9D5GYP6_PEA|nr:hypothetical protein KIW84_014099 [Pisum sativum]